MPAPNLSSYKVAASELSSSTKFNNLVQAIQDEFGVIDADQIPGYPSDATKFLRGDGSWAVPSGAPGYGIALPGLPVDGQEFILVDSTSAPTYAWRFRFNNAKASNKWDFIGGSSIYAEVTTDEATTSSTYAAMTTAGPSIAVPVAGSYVVEIGAYLGSGNSSVTAFMSYDIGATGAVDADAIKVATWASMPGDLRANEARARVKALTAVTLTAKYKCSVGGNNCKAADRWMRVTPIAVGG